MIANQSYLEVTPLSPHQRFQQKVGINLSENGISKTYLGFKYQPFSTLSPALPWRNGMPLARGLNLSSSANLEKAQGQRVK